jgi:hypothetical protein
MNLHYMLLTFSPKFNNNTKEQWVWVCDVSNGRDPWENFHGVLTQQQLEYAYDVGYINTNTFKTLSNKE